ncbi:hypothetical protein [Pseudoxanthomonas sp. PXM02]|uniref:FliH/SctL family protein n=1 Tax=Pseudoxanthomonas sp. PXM02 TaxID=2769294 RepID=UPI00178187F8|nr:hypothetical protein [Pseudoxanthomonas sp. PXM02]MBD9477420.1 hypothetical protein [Pseudoxanthomonas sp. PXM02]
MTKPLVRRLDATGLELRAWSSDEPAVDAPVQEAAELAQQRLIAAQRQQQDELERQRERGYQAGMAEGRSDAAMQAKSELALMKKRLEDELTKAKSDLDTEKAGLQLLAARLEQALGEAEREAEEAAVQAAYAALTRLLEAREADGELLPPLVRQALVDAGGDTHVLWVSTQDRDALGELAAVDLRVDSTLKRGQIRLQSRLGHYDTGLDVRLDQIKHAFLSGLAAHRRKGES